MWNINTRWFDVGLTAEPYDIPGTRDAFADHEHGGEAVAGGPRLRIGRTHRRIVLRRRIGSAGVCSIACVT